MFLRTQVAAGGWRRAREASPWEEGEVPVTFWASREAGELATLKDLRMFVLNGGCQNRSGEKKTCLINIEIIIYTAGAEG